MPITDAFTPPVLNVDEVGDWGGLDKLTQVQSLSLNVYMPSNEYLVHLVPLKQLRELSLTSHDLNEVGIAHLASLPNLSVLSIRTDTATAQHLKRLKKLEVIHLYGEYLGSLGVRHLVEVKGLKKVVAHGIDVDSETEDLLRKAHPGLELERVPTGTF